MAPTWAVPGLFHFAADISLKIDTEIELKIDTETILSESTKVWASFFIIKVTVMKLDAFVFLSKILSFFHYL